MRAGEAAAAAGVTIKALRYYEECGLLSPGRAANGYRDYSAEDVRLAEEIRGLGRSASRPRRRGRSWPACAPVTRRAITARSPWPPISGRSRPSTSSSTGWPPAGTG
ncbi:MerR family transcriptional regulator [Streptomyces huasconensis]|uniref:MerR family transcriptional regulator n=1 Tax=Streptomyces huasconensis TaxID=1854574 RepID=UPI0033D58316